MLKFKKDYNLKIISLLVALVFFLNSTVYGIDLSNESHLRPPSQFNPLAEESRDILRQEGIKEVVNPLDALSDPALREFISLAMKTIYAQHGVSEKTTDGIIEILFSRYAENSDIVSESLRSYIANTDFSVVYQDYESKKTVKGRLGLTQRFIEGPLVADIGCGSGDISEAIIQNVQGVKRIIATDITEYHTITNPSIEFRLHSRADRIPIDSNIVDTVVLSYMLHHVEPDFLENLLREVNRILKPGCKVIILEDSYSNTIKTVYESELLEKFLSLDSRQKEAVLAFNDWLGNIVFRGLGLWIGYSYKSMEEWESLFNKVGFSVVEKQSLGIPRDSFHFAPRGLFVLKYMERKATQRATDSSL